MRILTSNLVKDLDYSPSYFLKILSRCNVKSRIILDVNDLEKILDYFQQNITNHKSYNTYIHIKNLLNT